MPPPPNLFFYSTPVINKEWSLSGIIISKMLLCIDCYRYIKTGIKLNTCCVHQNVESSSRLYTQVLLAKYSDLDSEMSLEGTNDV